MIWASMDSTKGVVYISGIHGEKGYPMNCLCPSFQIYISQIFERTYSNIVHDSPCDTEGL